MFGGYSLIVERFVVTEEVAGASPVIRPYCIGGLTQLVEYRPFKPRVGVQVS